MKTTDRKFSGRAVARRIRPSGIRVRKAVLTTSLALIGLAVSTHYGGLLGEPGPHHPLADRAVAGASAVVFLVCALVAVRGATEDLVSLVPGRFGDTRVTTLRMLCLLTGYAMVVLGSLSLLHVPWSKLILGGALTGVIVGIAAQPVLGNIFAGLVLLTARPFHIAEDVTIRAGALGGAVQGRVTDMTLLFVQLRTSDGTVLLPNSAVLSAAIAPADRPGAAGRGAAATREEPGSTEP
ncbi:mechanosensitive ion channel domain-containing protein [Streptacidiphilus sp. P02-A3a]|uniref:mechanosensitive ion channel domain-containing protein n=1 Tax=Streptacidiphilus sp. P02-A3a TaxID=2704468 RepID=UPI0015FDF865|nr:mechanosensitive ion channel domain-containing protein [Streptacidiphilus sp. P02-A3a]QMU70555.1 mechanosensitive ion channel [Streptacidiphilus sp. P02-A3a]